MNTVTEVSIPDRVRRGAFFVEQDRIASVSRRHTFAQHGPRGGFAFFFFSERDIDSLNQLQEQLATDRNPIVFF
jgi:hypothetical protein